MPTTSAGDPEQHHTARPAVWSDEGGVTMPAWTVTVPIDGKPRTYWFRDEEAAHRFAAAQGLPGDPVAAPST